MQLEIERVSRWPREGRRVARAAGADRRRARRAEEKGGAEGAVAAEKDGITRIGESRRRSRPRGRDGRAERAAISTAPPSSASAALTRLEKGLDASSSGLAEPAEGRRAVLREEVDEEDIAATVAKWTGIPVTRLLEGEIQKLVQMEERARPARGRPGRGRLARRQRRAPRARDSATPTGPSARSSSSGPPASARPSWPGARRVPVRRRARHDPHRHVGVHGEAHGGAPDRRAARLRRLRRGRPAHRGGAPPPVLGGPVRRDREGAPGRLQRAAADARRRPAHRRPGPHGRLPQHRRDHDVEHRAATSSASTSGPRRCGRS